MEQTHRRLFDRRKSQVLEFWHSELHRRICRSTSSVRAEEGHHGFVMTGFPDLHDEPILSDLYWDAGWAATEADRIADQVPCGGGGTMLTAKEGEIVKAHGLLDGRPAIAGKDTTRGARHLPHLPHKRQVGGRTADVNRQVFANCCYDHLSDYQMEVISPRRFALRRRFPGIRRA